MEWKTTWSYLPINYNTVIGTVENITQRTFIRNNLTGNRIKIKFSNLYSDEQLLLEKVVIGELKPDNQLIENFSTITYQGESKIAIGPGEEFYSDELVWEITAGTEIVVSIYVKASTNIQSACSTWAARSWHTIYALEGNHTLEQNMEAKKSEEIYPYVQADANKANIIFGLSEIKILTIEKVKTVALFGDSITHMSYYSDALIERAYSKYPGTLTILNRGIGGNRLLHDATFFPEMPGEGKCFGKAGIERFKQDVYSTDLPESIIILEGVNDMMHPYVFKHPDEIVSAKDLENAVESLVRTAHEMGSQVYLGTVTPFRNNEMEWLADSEKVREEFNQWIREQKVADGVIDFDQIICSTDNPEYIREGFHIGDGLHPNTEGGKAMSEAVPIEWLE